MKLFPKTLFKKDDEKNIWSISFLTCAFILVLGLLADSPEGILKGILTYLGTPDILVTDYYVVGSAGAALVNSGIVMLISLELLKAAKTPLTGNILARSFLMAGFALFGKNLLNILPFILGVYIYCAIRKLPMVNYTAAALYSTALAPIVSAVVTNYDIPTLLRIPLGIASGALISYILIPIADHSFGAHMGYTLFNYGFAGGLLALLIASIVKGVSHHSIALASIWNTGIDKISLFFIISLCSFLIMWGLIQNEGDIKPFLRIMRHTGRAPSDFVITDSLASTAINMGVVGFIALFYIMIIGGDLNGPVLGAILTCIGFAAIGIHPRNMIPIMLGVFLASLTMHYDSSMPSLQLAALFGTALAPIAGTFGAFYGIMAGFLHAFLVLTIGEPCGGFNLYNNGFSAGLVAIIMVGFIQGFSKRWHRAVEVEVPTKPQEEDF